MTAPQAAGVIHSDLERGFIRAEVMKYEDFIQLGTETCLPGSRKTVNLKGKIISLLTEILCISGLMFKVEFRMQEFGIQNEPGTWNLEPETWNLKPETWNLEPETWNLKPETWNLKPETWNLKPGT